MKNNQGSASDITVAGLLSSLKLVQLWSIVVILFGLLGGSFVLGYKANALRAESEIAKYENKIESLEKKSKQFLGLQTKERFLAFYLRYLIAKRAHEASPSEDTEADMKRIGDNFSAHIDKLLKRGDDASDEIDLRGLFFGKGGGRDATVVFGYDGSKWPVPPEFGFWAKK